MQRIALLGLGNMGSAMATRWLGQGFSVAVWNRNSDKAAAFVASGARAGATPREAASDADVVVSMLADDDASRPVWLGAEGALAGMRRGAIAIECSTVSPAWVRELAEHAAATGVGFLDAPVGGGPAAVAAGTLTVFAGGDVATLDAARPVLSAIASRIEHVGETGAGATWKLINYMMAGAQLAGLAEVLMLAEKAGIAPQRAADLIRNSVTASPAVIGKLARMVDGRYDNPDVALRLVAKDERYGLDLARALGANPEILPTVSAIYERAVADGLGDLDLAAVAATVRRRSGLTS
ncbi:MAG TPA: NAD(P)-dependent oxidoreductase [Bauldia sp.]|nr:NAD(P)-dependent oxidoreductase [Bauldia sp.]